MIGWNFQPDFKGEEIDEEVKNKIDSIPPDVFYPKYQIQKKVVQKEKKKEDLFKNFLKDISSADEIEMKNYLNSIEFPEPNLFKNLKKREEETLKRQKEKEMKKKLEEIEIEKEKEKIENVKKENEDYKIKLKDFYDFTLKNQPETLLNELYIEEVDSKITLKILHELETKGTLKIEEKDENEEENLIKEYIEQKNKKKIEIENIEILPTIPNLSGAKTSEDTLKILREFSELKDNYVKKKDFELNESKLKILLNLEKEFSKTEEQKNEWTKYLNENYIKKYENEIFLNHIINTKPKDFNEKLKNLEKNENILFIDEKFKFQFENPILNENDHFKKYLKSKL